MLAPLKRQKRRLAKAHPQRGKIIWSLKILRWWFQNRAPGEDAFMQKYSKEQVESAIAYGMQSDFREELQPLGTEELEGGALEVLVALMGHKSLSNSDLGYEKYYIVDVLRKKNRTKII